MISPAVSQAYSYKEVLQQAQSCAGPAVYMVVIYVTMNITVPRWQNLEIWNIHYLSKLSSIFVHHQYSSSDNGGKWVMCEHDGDAVSQDNQCWEK